MRTRNSRWLLAASIAIAGATGSVSPGAAAPRFVPVPAKPIVQRQSGVARGGDRLSLIPLQQFDAGSYVANGQLGRGRYEFTLTYDDQSGSTTAHGTAKLIRNDGAVLSGTVSFLETGPTLEANHVVYNVTLTHGSRELVGAQLIFRGQLSNQINPGGESGSEALVFAGTSSATTRVGYWMLDAGGRVYRFGGAQPYGSASTSAAVHVEPSPSSKGYWVVNAAGRVFAFGDTRPLGNANAAALDAGEHVVSLSATPSGNGYWLFTSHGRVLPFGDTKDYGDLHRGHLNAGIVGSIATPTGNGYYMVAADGGVFAFGDAKFRGSMGATHLNQPVVGLVPTADNRGYWLVASDGGVFAFNAPFRGSMGGVRLNRPITGMVRYGTGYLMIASDGGIFDFSNRPFFGSLGGAPPALAITGAASAG